MSLTVGTLSIIGKTFFAAAKPCCTAMFSVANDPEVRTLSPIFNELDKMERDERFVEWARYPLPSYSKIIEQVGNELFEFLFLNKDLQTTLEQCQKSASRLLV